MNNFFEKKNVEKLWWYGLNILTTLFIVSFVNINAPQGPAGSPGSNGVNGVDGQDGQNGAAAGNVYPLSAIEYDEAPVGAARAAYAQARIEEGFIPIDSIEDLAVFTTSVDEIYSFGNPSAYDNKYVLTADLDYFGEQIDITYPNMIAGFAEYTGGGQDSISFGGIFDGAGYSIKNFTIERGEWDYSVGFFPTTSDAIIRNVTFENLTAKAIIFEGYLGGVVGTVTGDTLIQNVTLNNIEIYSDSIAGGFVGEAQDNLYLLNVRSNLGHIVANYIAGGLVGQSTDNYALYIQDSVNRATVDHTFDPDYYGSRPNVVTAYGGLVGRVQNSDKVIINNAINAGLVSSNHATGGFFGSVEKAEVFVVANSFNAGYVSSRSVEDPDEESIAEAGGFVGNFENEYLTYFQNSYNVGEIYSSDNAVGGFVAEIHSNVNDERDDLFVKPVYFTNVYNAGHISSSEYSDEKGGIIGEVRNDRYVHLQNVFNVGTFSRSIVTGDLASNFKDNGAIVGDCPGFEIYDNVTYFYDLDNPENYLDRATDRLLDEGATQLNDISSFTSENFHYDGSWDLDNVWEFKAGSYEFPVLRGLSHIEPEESRLYDPIVFYAYMYTLEVITNVETGDNEIVLKDLYAEIGDAETAPEDMLLNIYAMPGEPTNSLDTLLENGEKVFEQRKDFLDIWEDEDAIYYVPTLGDGTYAFYVVAEDGQGNQTLQLFEEEYSIDYVTASDTDTEAPVPGNGGALSAEFTFFPDDITFTFVEATDNITSQENLGYAAVVAQSGFDFTTWDFNPEISAILGYNEFTNLNIAAGSYVFEDDFFEADFNTRYEVALIVFDEAGNYAYYQTTFVEYID